MYAALLTAVVTWIAANFDLPRDYDHPQVKLVPAVEITLLRYQAFTPGATERGTEFTPRNHGRLPSPRGRRRL